jgi:hypothetical protein
MISRSTKPFVLRYRSTSGGSSEIVSKYSSKKDVPVFQYVMPAKTGIQSLFLDFGSSPE